MTTGAAPSALLADRLLDALPQTQCKRCGYADCAAYAQAMALGEAPINQCAPGGAEGIRRLQAITGTPHSALPLNPDFGEEGPRTVAFIDEDWCIGCTLCVTACPVDAIVGANKRMHTVIESHCTGCELCLPVCPVDCILLENVTAERTGWAAWSPAQAQEARQRHADSRARRQREEEAHQQKLEAKARLKLSDLAAHSQHTDPAILDKKRSIIQAALERARALRAR